MIVCGKKKFRMRLIHLREVVRLLVSSKLIAGKFDFRLHSNILNNTEFGKRIVQVVRNVLVLLFLVYQFVCDSKKRKFEMF